MITYPYTIIEKPWGYEQILEIEDNLNDSNQTITKNLVVFEGEKISYQFHYERTETWLVVSGDCIITIAGKEYKAFPGTKWKIDKEVYHRIQALSDVVIYEVSKDVAEGDIVRVEDDYGRKEKKWPASLADCHQRDHLGLDDES